MPPSRWLHVSKGIHQERRVLGQSVHANWFAVSADEESKCCELLGLQELESSQ